MQPDCSPEELERAARTSVAMDRLVAEHDLGSLAYYYMGTGNPANEDAISSIILGNSLLTARGIPVAGEHEIKNVQAMKIMDSFGVGGSFTEYYAMDYNDDVVLMGHDGPGHIAIAQGKTKVRPLEVYHGKVGRGLSVEMSVKHGPVTLLSVVQTVDGQLKLLVAEGESVAGPILEIGNTNSRYRFPIGAARFVESWNAHGPAHHCAVGVGHIAGKIEKLGCAAGHARRASVLRIGRVLDGSARSAHNNHADHCWLRLLSIANCARCALAGDTPPTTSPATCHAQRQRRLVLVHGRAGDRRRRQADRRLDAGREGFSHGPRRSELGQRRTRGA